MKHNSAELIFPGTGSAMPKQSYNACMVVSTPSILMLTDAGGGNGILRELDRSGIDMAELHHFFVTHVHTDHVLGAVWVVRMAVYLAKCGRYSGRLNVYGNADVIHAIDEICRLTFLPGYYADVAKVVNYVDVAAEPKQEINGNELQFFDVGSQNVAQTGFRMRMAEKGCEIGFLGDESLTERNAEKVAGADVLVCGAFCRYADRDIFKPYEKHHHTVRDVAAVANQAHVKKLVLIHCEDSNLAERAQLYAEEAATEFSGPVYVPADGGRITL